ncbi:DUF2141 domain-containing protein [Flavobacterium tegetincola]|jgi:uncharacterized protein (DUF2141 family)|nr:DUF2141 domain-containing protein [Flavobacterium tegetincola]
MIHDENRNGELDSNMFGIPKQDYGFSNVAKVTSSPPSFCYAAFSYD